MHESILHDPFNDTPSVFTVLEPKEGETVLDVTLGLGGHARTFGGLIGATGTLLALDADSQNLEDAKKKLQDVPCKTQLIHANFSQLPSLDLPKVDVLFADLGLSSPHLDDASRGFSFRASAPLDMRFDRTSGRTAAELLRNSSFEDIRTILKEYGELRESGYVARAIADTNASDTPIETTTDLVNCIQKTLGWRTPQLLPKIFQAIRIAVNDELGALKILLEHGPTLLKPGGRMGVISFHSLEDRMVKLCFRELCAVEKDEVTGQDKTAPRFFTLTKKSIVPSQKEIDRNPRARSAKFRAVRKAL